MRGVLGILRPAPLARDMVLIAEIRPVDGLVHEVGADGCPDCGAATSLQWHLVTRVYAVDQLHLMPCSCCRFGMGG